MVQGIFLERDTVQIVHMYITGSLIIQHDKIYRRHVQIV